MPSSALLQLSQASITTELGRSAHLHTRASQGPQWLAHWSTRNPHVHAPGWGDGSLVNFVQVALWADRSKRNTFRVEQCYLEMT